MSQVKNQGPTFWRALAERENRPEWREAARREPGAELDEELAREVAEDVVQSADPTGRRRFLKVAGASVALAGTTACEDATDGIRWKKDYILPFSKRPPTFDPGKEKHYSTVMELGGVGLGLRVESYDGRPIKVEGNPNHPDSVGAATVFAQAAIREMYDPDRSQSPARYDGGKRQPAQWLDFEEAGRRLFDDHKAKGGQGLAFLAAASTSPSQAEIARRLRQSFPSAKWAEWEPASRDNERAGSKLAFDDVVRTVVHFNKARVVLCLDADPFVDHPSAIRHARDFMQGRVPEHQGYMHRLYSVESRFSSTGGVADHRLPLPSSQIKAFAAALDGAISAAVGGPDAGAAQPPPQAAFLGSDKVKKMLDAVAKDLVANKGKCAVVAGAHQPPEVHAIVHRLNHLLEAVGDAVTYVADPDPTRPSHLAAMEELVGAMNGGQVETLVVLGGNPVFDAPSDLDFPGAYAKVGTRIHLSLYEDETSRASTWHLPLAHWLEAWGDARAWDGTTSVAQPLIEPLFGGRSVIELLAFVINDDKQKGLDLVRRTHAGWAGDERIWQRALHEGVVPGTALAPATPELRPIAAAQYTPAEQVDPAAVKNGELELVLIPDPTVYDGRFANNSWLQELPEMMTKLTWDNAALMSPATAKQLGVSDGGWVQLEVGGRSLKVPALAAPGTAPGTIVLAYGRGRTEAGRFGGSTTAGVAPVGANAYTLRTKDLFHFGRGLTAKAGAKHAHVSTTQDKHVIDQVGAQGTEARLPMLVREQTLDEYKKAPDGAQHVVHHKGLLSLWQDPVRYDGHKWGMAIDLNKCIGCNACVVACQAENNIPTVGKDKVARGKEMHWIRIDRYFKGDPEDPELAHQPVTCHQCEHAPCEQVCPVGATMHSDEGINDMVYNRCIGTRYCSNNCPYKVRRFNFHNYQMEYKDDAIQKIAGLHYNPDVTVRFRGVMEKCTFCVQRIKAVTITARNHRREVQDGDIVTACQQTCPTGAIAFGDLNDGKAKVTHWQNQGRAYSMLEELNVRPRLKYLARIRNPNPELAPPPPAEEGHGGGHSEEGHG